MILLQPVSAPFITLHKTNWTPTLHTNAKFKVHFLLLYSLMTQQQIDTTKYLEMLINTWLLWHFQLAIIHNWL